MRVELGLPVVVDVPLADAEAAGLELVVLEGATERVPVFVDVAVFVESPVIVACEEGAAVTLAADVRVEVLVGAAEEVISAAPSSKFLRRLNASAPNSVVLIHGDVVRVPKLDNKSIHRILY